MKRILSVIIALVMLATCVTVAAAFALAVPASAASPFDDVAESRWSYASVNYAVNKGYMKGTGERKFSPADTLTRAMVATVLWRRQGEPAPTAPSGFSDVPEGKWYSEAIAWAKETGVVQGVSDTKFKPNDNVTREQLATMLFRFSETAPVCVPERADLGVFPDGSSVRDWAREAMGWAVEAALVKGSSDGSLDPSGFATREQFAAIMERFDGTFRLEYKTPIIRTGYTEKEYPPVDDADFYVAADGDDSADGSLEHPFRTWERARDAVRTLDKTDRDGITVAFFAGDYGELSVALTAEDSGTPDCPVVYCRYGDGDVVFSGGLEIEPEDFAELTEEEKAYFPKKAADKIRKTDVSSVLDAGIAAGDVIVFYDGGLCVEARYPNRFQDGSDHLLAAASYNDNESLTIFNPIVRNRLSKYGELAFSTMKTYGYIIRGYRKDTFIVGGYDPETAVLSIANWETSEFGRMRDWMGVDGEGIMLAITNVPDELDFDHEYWIDPSAGILYAYDPDGTYHIPVRGDMVVMEEANDVTFRGLTFRNTSGSFIRGELCHGVTLDRCSFSGCSSTAGVSFKDCSVERPMGFTVSGCDFSNNYGAAVYANGGCANQYRFEKRSDILFDNNFVSSSNLVYDVECAVDLPRSSGVTVTHNEFRNTSRGAVSFSGSYDVLVEYNAFIGIMQNSEDGGAVYSNGSADGWHVTIRHNFFDYMSPAGTGTFGYYVDDNTCGVEICENLFYDAASSVMIHLGRDNVVRDNVFIHGGVSFSVGQRNEIDELGLEDAKKKGGEFRKTMNCWTRIFNNIETYPEYRAGIEKWCPEVLKYHLDYDRLDDPYFVMNPVNYVRDNVYINTDGKPMRQEGQYVETYVKYEGGRGFTFEENPMFVNPTAGDYRVRAGAEDFPDIEFEKIGRY